MEAILDTILDFGPLECEEKFHGDRPTGTPTPGELNTTGVVKYSDFGPIDSYLGNGARWEVS